ncbi:HAD family hydrolase [Gammaproteobacteria bacterium]|nr:HAD family hydrolase [Gammaproteobacteria bacterium]
MIKALFLDRDGVINFDKGYVHKQKDFIFKNEIFDIVKLANLKKYAVIIITNQSGIARGYFKIKDFNILTEWVLGQFIKNKCEIKDVYFCPFHKNGKVKKYAKDSFLRKPLPGMINNAVSDYDIDINESILIGDKFSDIEAGNAAGIKINLLLNETGHKLHNNKNISYTEITSLLEAEVFFK